MSNLDLEKTGSLIRVCDALFLQAVAQSSSKLTPESPNHILSNIEINLTFCAIVADFYLSMPFYTTVYRVVGNTNVLNKDVKLIVK